MSKRHPNARLVKIHRTYNVEEVASLFGVHRNTVRNWLKIGLEAIDDARPTLILGRHLVSFLTKRRNTNRRPCSNRELYCLRCKAPREPQSSTVLYVATTSNLGNLVGHCGVCGLKMFRRVSSAKLAQFEGKLTVIVQQAESRIDEMIQCSSICDLSLEAIHHENA